MRWGRNLWSVRVALKARRARGLKHSEVAPGVEASQAAPPAAGDWKGKGGSWAAAVQQSRAAARRQLSGS